MASQPLIDSEPILDDKHGSRYLTSTKPVSIGDNLWIEVNTAIFPGLVIGNNVTIRAGRVATKSIPENVLAFDNTFKIVKQL